MLITDKDLLIYNGQDEEARAFLSSLPKESWSQITLVDYYENSKHSIAVLDDLRQQGVHFSGSWMFVTLFGNPTRPVGEEVHIGTINKPSSWDEYQQNKMLKLCEMLVEYTAPPSYRVQKMKDAICQNANVPLSVMAAVLSCETLLQIEGVWAKIVKEGVLTPAEQGAIIKIRELVYAEK
jgi:hypothetical protein